jgi:acyl-CoA synthetase (AMP-forming)/AMP-acid ligase II
MNLHDVTSFYNTLKQTGTFAPHPGVALSQFVTCYLRYGSSLSTLAAWSALRFPNRIALTESNRSVTFQQLIHNAQGRAVMLRQTFNIRERQTVGLLGRNSIAFVETLLACELLGAKILLLHTTFNSEDLTRVHQRQPFSFLLCDEEFETRAKTFLQGLQNAKALIPQIVNLEAMTSNIHSSSPVPNYARQSNLVLLTSGTTGPAKLIGRRPRLSLKTLTGLLESLQLKAGAKTLLTVPILHGHGLSTLTLTFLLGAPLFLFAKASSEDFLHCIEEHAIKVLVVVPTILYRLLEQPQNSYQTKNLSHIISGSAALDEIVVKHTLHRFGDILYNLYGSSEFGLISLATPTALQQAPTTIGSVLPGVNVRITKEGQLEVKQGSHYGGTGDQGYFDNTGKLFLLGRYDDMLICGGKNIYLQDLETLVQQKLEYVLEVAAMGVPDLEFGQSVHWFIVLKPTCKNITPERIKQDLEALFPKSIKPSHVSIVSALPKTPSGKIARHQLQTQFTPITRRLTPSS